MIAAINHDQGWTPAGSGRPVTRRHGMPAPVADRYQSQFPARRSYLPRRANCRDRQDSPAFFFRPTVITLYDLDHLNLCELSRRQPAIARQSIPDHLIASTAGEGQGQ